MPTQTDTQTHTHTHTHTRIMTTSPMHWRHCAGCASQNARSRCKLTFKVLDSAPRYLGPTYLVGVLCGQQVPAAWSYRPSNCLLLAAVPFRLLQLKFGTACQRPSYHRHHCRLSVVNQRLIFFNYPIHT